MFVDETAATTNMARRYGRRRRGQRLRCGVPHGHYKAITFVFGLRLRGVVAPKAYDHAMNAGTFEAWLERHLLPTLEEGDIVVLDNLKAHKSPRVAEILVRKNCTIRYLPPYSPDFNPIERAISKLKSALRKARRPRPYRNLGELRRSLPAGRLPKLFQGLRLSSRRTPSPRHNLNGFRSKRLREEDNFQSSNVHRNSARRFGF